ncbi:MAG: helix-turn-helix transcriptional regulator [Terriglobia bacterium]
MRRVWAEGETPAPGPSPQAKRDEAPLQPSDAGFLLLDSSLRPIYANQDAVGILCHPEAPKPSKALMQAIKRRINSLLRGHLPNLGSPSLVEFTSGKRRYLLRAFYLDSHIKNPLQPVYALLIERGHHVLLELANISNQYNLTNREIETMRLLLGGLTSKEIASRMKISPNTVKVFLRLIMMKMGVTTRAGIIGKFVSS